MDTSLFSSLLKARKAKGITQAQLSELLGLTQSYISQVEQSRHDIKTSTLTEWARALDLELMLVPRQHVPSISYLIQAGSEPQRDLPAAYGPLPDEVE
ncbi:MAG: helix-turn-helix domain-containing protein [Candidatus Obscuribacterales bacterium]|nr:helix-turn-helix domain-containing protein [Candidatus Obscuribacterales bacterium]